VGRLRVWQGRFCLFVLVALWWLSFRFVSFRSVPFRSSLCVCWCFVRAVVVGGDFVVAVVALLGALALVTQCL